MSPRKKKTVSAGKNVKEQKTGAESGSEDLLDMSQAIAMLKTTRPTFYRWLRSGKIKGMKVGRQWRFHREDIERFLRGEGPRIDLPADIDPLIGALTERIKGVGGKVEQPEELGEVKRTVYLMIQLGYEAGASDLHIYSHMEQRKTIPSVTLRCRIDGVLHHFADIDPRLLPALIEEWKRMSACDVHEKSKPQVGRASLKLSQLNDGYEDAVIDLRTSFLPTGLGESLTARILSSNAATFSLAGTEMDPENQEKLLRGMRSPCGVVIITGPTGCGKTTTIYGCLNEIAGPSLKIMTVEDPIEYFLPWAIQSAVNEGKGMTFRQAIVAMLRSDPDVIMIGEIRSADILGLVQSAALTGHLVVTNLHTQDAASGLTRMVDIGSDPFVVADTTKVIAAQRLVRKLCPECRVEDKPVRQRLEHARELARKGGLAWDLLDKNFYKAVGCGECAETGYKQRTVISEVLEITPEIGRALKNKAGHDELRTIAVGQGMITMGADGVRLAASGETSLDEILRIVG
ncbi:ATPase, T2SS/T4P/T4SS family [Candidatus Hydrogenedentota bacterium]